MTAKQYQKAQTKIDWAYYCVTAQIVCGGGTASAQAETDRLLNHPTSYGVLQAACSRKVGHGDCFSCPVLDELLY